MTHAETLDWLEGQAGLPCMSGKMKAVLRRTVERMAQPATPQEQAEVEAVLASIEALPEPAADEEEA